jgi:hypothetical protein
MTYLKLWQTGRNKFHAKKTMVNGKKYDSLKEGSKAMELEMLKKTKAIKDFESHKKIELYGVNGTRVCNYFADFVITHNDGTTEILDVKSKITATPVFKLKWHLLEDKYFNEVKRGEIKLTIEY